MNIEIIYRCASQSDIEKANLSIAQFKDKNTEYSYKFCVCCDKNIGNIPENTDDIEYKKASPIETLQVIADAIRNDNRFVILSDVVTVCATSLEPLFNKLDSLDSLWQICGNMEFSYETISNGTNFEVCSDYSNSYISSRFCIFNCYFAQVDIDEFGEFLELTDDGEFGEFLDFINDGHEGDPLATLTDSNSNFYDAINLLINTVNWERIVCPEIVFDTGYNLKRLQDGYVGIISDIDCTDPEQSSRVHNNYVYLPILDKFIKDNDIELSDTLKKDIEHKAIAGYGDMLTQRHNFEYIEAKVGTREWNLVM